MFFFFCICWQSLYVHCICRYSYLRMQLQLFGLCHGKFDLLFALKLSMTIIIWVCLLSDIISVRRRLILKDMQVANLRGERLEGVVLKWSKMASEGGSCALWCILIVERITTQIGSTVVFGFLSLLHQWPFKFGGRFWSYFASLKYEDWLYFSYHRRFDAFAEYSMIFFFTFIKLLFKLRVS